jgi:hypothetical protein
MKHVLVTVLFTLAFGLAQKIPHFLYINTPILKPNEVISGTLDEEDGQNLKDGSRLEVVQGRFMEGETLEFVLTSDFDGYLTVYAPDKTVLTSDDDTITDEGYEGYQSSVITEIPESGRYVFIVSGYSEYDLGNYEISARGLEVSEDGAITLPAELNGVISVSDEIAEFIDTALAEEAEGEDGAPGYLGEFNYDAFTFELSETTTVRLEATSPTLDTIIEVLDAEGNQVAFNDDQNVEDDLETPDYDESLDYTINAGVEVTLEPGSYEIRVAAYDYGFYTLTASVIEE